MDKKPSSKKLSRRDAIKLLGAVTGATVLSNLPSKWSTPQIAHGVLPAHAQTSNTLLTFIDGGFIQEVGSSSPQVAQADVQKISTQHGGGSGCYFRGNHWIQISEKIKDIPLVLVDKSPIVVDWDIPGAGPQGVYLTDADGKVTIPIAMMYLSVQLEWSFQNSSHGVDIKTFNRSCNPL